MTDNAPPAGGQGVDDSFFEDLLVRLAHRPSQAYRRRSGRPLACRRLTAIERLVYGRHAGPVDTDDGEVYFEAALPYLAVIGRMHDRPILPVEWAQRVTPRFYAEVGPAWFSGQERGAGRSAFPTADQFGRQLAVTDAEVQSYGLSTVGAVDRNKAQRLVDRKEKDRLRQKAKRASAGATPREQSQAALKPWAALGISESTWRRGRKPSQPESVRLGDSTSSTSIKRSENVWTKRRHGGSLTTETTTPEPWVVVGVSRAKWYRDRAAAAVSVVMPDPAHANDEVAQAPRIVLEVGRVRLDAVQLAAWSEEFPGLDVLELVKADVRTLDDGAADAQPWQDQAWAYLSWAHHEMTVVSNNNIEMSTSKAV